MPAAPMLNAPDRSRTVPDYLEGDMTVRDLIEVLSTLQFHGKQATAEIELDRAVADFLVGLLTEKTRRA